MIIQINLIAKYSQIVHNIRLMEQIRQLIYRCAKNIRLTINIVPMKLVLIVQYLVVIWLKIKTS